MSRGLLPLLLHRPVLVFDGRCSFCRRLALRCEARTGRRVLYIPLQMPLLFALAGVRRADARRSVQFIEPSGRRSHGALAIFRLLGRTPGFRLVSWIGRLPFVRWPAELVYRLVASHRPLAGRVDRWLLGTSTRSPGGRAVRWVFLRALGAVYLVAFRSLGAQVLGLYGSHGILPIHELLDAVRAQLGPERHRLFPTIFWLDASDRALVRACRAGEILSLALILGVAPRLALAALWALYLSFVSVGREFLGYQWDALLLEATPPAIVYAPRGLLPGLGREEPSAVATLLLRALAFKLHFESGLAKLRSGDPAWRDLTANCYHYETQPLPTKLGWYAHHLPMRAQKLATAAVLFCECVVPFLAFAPRRPRRLGFGLLTALQAAIAATGNYGFFNLLSAALAIPLLDDDALPRGAAPRGSAPRRAPLRRRLVDGAATAALFALSATAHLLRYGPRRPPKPLARAVGQLAPLHTFNTYGLFSAMTRARPEIVIEATEDGLRWAEYELPYKPGDPTRAPARVAPHQPRLDWQMWFAALEPPGAWFIRLMERLLETSPDVLALFRRAPLGDRRPPAVRARLYLYRATDLETMHRTGAYWTRERIGMYLLPVALRPAHREGGERGYDQPGHAEAKPSTALEGATRPR